jgi:hypothetical protein
MTAGARSAARTERSTAGPCSRRSRANPAALPRPGSGSPGRNSACFTRHAVQSSVMSSESPSRCFCAQSVCVSSILIMNTTNNEESKQAFHCHDRRLPGRSARSAGTSATRINVGDRTTMTPPAAAKCASSSAPLERTSELVAFVAHVHAEQTFLRVSCESRSRVRSTESSIAQEAV